MKNIVAAGLGGQGVLSTGLIIANIAMNEGMEVTWLPAFGSEMRGGDVNCDIKIGSSKIASPFIREIDILIALSKSAIDTYEDSIVKNGTIIVDTSMVPNAEYRSDLNIIEVDANKIMDETGNPRGRNVSILGGFVKGTDLFDKDAFADGIEKFFEARNIKNKKNRETFLKGYELSK